MVNQDTLTYSFASCHIPYKNVDGEWQFPFNDGQNVEVTLSLNGIDEVGYKQFIYREAAKPAAVSLMVDQFEITANNMLSLDDAPSPMMKRMHDFFKAEQLKLKKEHEKLIDLLNLRDVHVQEKEDHVYVI